MMSTGRRPTPYVDAQTALGRAHKLGGSGVRDLVYHVGQMVQMTVDTSRGGDGPLSATAKGIFSGAVPDVSVKQLGISSFLVQFTPSMKDEYRLAITWGEQQVEGSPFIFKFREASEPDRVKVLGLTGRRFVADEPVTFVIHAQDAGSGEIVVRATGPSLGTEPSRVILEDQNDATFMGKYFPAASGEHELMITWGDTPVPGSPFRIRVLENASSTASRVTLHGPGLSGRVLEANKPIELLVDTSLAGGGTVTASAANRSGQQLKIDVFKTGPNAHLLRMEASYPDVYEVSVLYEGSHIAGSPFSVNFSRPPDPTACVVRGLRSGSLAVGEPVVFTVDTDDAGAGELVIRASGPTKGQPAQLQITNNEDDTYTATYTPTAHGTHTFHVLWSGIPIPGSPFKVDIHPAPGELQADASNCFVYGPALQYTGVRKLGDICTFTIQAQDAGPGTLDVKVSGPIKTESELSVEDNGNGSYNVTLQPSAPGDFALDVLWSGRPVTGSPFTFRYRDNVDSRRCRAHGPGLAKAELGKPATFRVETTGAGQAQLTVSALGESSRADVTVTKISSDVYNVEYLPDTPGAYIINVRWDGLHIPSSPYKVVINDDVQLKAARCHLAGGHIRDSEVGQSVEFVVHTKDAGEGILTCKAYGLHDTVLGYIVDEGDGRITMRFEPPKPGKYKVGIYFDGRHIADSPAKVSIYPSSNPSKVRAFGPGLQNGKKGLPGSFTIDTENAGGGVLEVRVQGPKGGFKAHLEQDPHSPTTFYGRYNPTESGDYDIEIEFSDQPVPGSPFKVAVTDS